MGFLIRKQRRPKKFSLSHRIYDERKDRLERQIASHDTDSLIESDREAYREQVRSRLARHRKPHNSSGSTLRILAIFAGLMILAYLLLFK